MDPTVVRVYSEEHYFCLCHYHGEKALRRTIRRDITRKISFLRCGGSGTSDPGFDGNSVQRQILVEIHNVKRGKKIRIGLARIVPVTAEPYRSRSSVQRGQALQTVSLAG